MSSSITIGEFALIGAGSIVTRDVHALVFGNPARQQGYVCRLSNIRTENNMLTGWCASCKKNCIIEIPPPA